jgi:ATP-dependent HslUV protease ATP-binding subunit HslU
VTIQLPAASEQLEALDGLTPREIVEVLDRHVVGQAAAKRAVAIALRNRLRRQRLPPEVAAEITPRNILMIGPTGVGKTEIARRLARLSKSPFVKVEASKFTEVGYVGRDVESMVRDLVANAVELVRQERLAAVREQAAAEAEVRLLDHLLPPSPAPRPATGEGTGGVEEARRAREQFAATREKLRQQLRSGALDAREVEVETRDKSPSFQVLTGQGAEELDVNVKDLLPGLFGGRTRKQRLKVPAAFEALRQEAEERLIDPDQVSRLAVERAESSGIVFIDEIDKIAGREGSHGPEISREGVQRDILPIVEGTTVNTKHGPVRTDHVLFVAAGAFHVSKPSDLIPELQGRFPIRVELESLGQNDLVRILTEPKSALLEQYRALLSTDGVELSFTPEAVEEIARLAMQVNETTENIGARRLATLLETVLEEVSFEAPHLASGRVEIDAEEVRRRVAPLVADRDLSRFIL